MKKKIIITAIAILIIAIITIIILMLKYNTNNSKVIYSSFFWSGGSFPSSTTINIYDNGIITKQHCDNGVYAEGNDENKETKKISKKDLIEIKESIEQVEKSELNRMNRQEYLEQNGFISFGNYKTININLNKKILLQNQTQICDNEEIHKLYEIISNIENKYFEEE